MESLEGKEQDQMLYASLFLWKAMVTHCRAF